LIGRQNNIGRRRPAIPDDYEEVDEYVAPAKYSEEQPSGYGYTRDSTEYGRGDQGSRSAEIRENADTRRLEEKVNYSAEAGEEMDKSSEEGCGSECRNLLHESDHPQEDSRCPYEGQVIDIWGYCRYQFEVERRDWRWWESIRQYMHSMGNSWANSYAPTVHQQMYHQG